MARRAQENEQKKHREPRRYAAIIFIIVVGTLLTYLYLIGPDLQKEPDGCSPAHVNPSAFDVKLSDKSDRTFDIEYAKTPLQQETGLSKRTCIPQDAALLFMFATDDTFGIWMKDMEFPIDVVWLDKDRKIIKVEKNMLPSSYPKVFRPAQDARYVFEFNAGVAESISANVGSSLTW